MEIYTESYLLEYLSLTDTLRNIQQRQMESKRGLGEACERLVKAAVNFGPKLESGASVYLNEIKSDDYLVIHNETLKEPDYHSVYNYYLFSLHAHTNVEVEIKVETPCYFEDDYPNVNYFTFPRFLLFMSDVALQTYFEEKAKEHLNEN